MASHEFRFKQFTIRQEGAAMKVGTDGVLLGAWCGVPASTGRVLDIGTGTGLVALMVAQRAAEAVVDAVELDKASAEQAQCNVSNSLWNGRIKVIHSDIRTYASPHTYRLIISNPPYFVDSLLPPDPSRGAARHTTSLNYEQLISAVAKLLGAEGVFAVILPFSQAENFIALATEKGLYVSRRTDVYPTPDSAPKRVLMEFSRVAAPPPPADSLTIESGCRHQYSAEYAALTHDFYLDKNH